MDHLPGTWALLETLLQFGDLGSWNTSGCVFEPLTFQFIFGACTSQSCKLQRCFGHVCWGEIIADTEWGSEEQEEFQFLNPPHCLHRRIGAGGTSAGTEVTFPHKPELSLRGQSSPGLVFVPWHLLKCSSFPVPAFCNNCVFGGFCHLFFSSSGG